ncbi:DUF6934 family protein [Dyadobacter luticola]|uniref:Uncharacterized protein n=1 Tax=Dyadobacter luticola TaxID=1979387 RepID=A0A5R9L467_9BACT|nr:hypothetical protein [Dyadobacter luticola]TLV03201.1 hypothetical protein FEN17_06200 [Dyadobacter luticola]
MKSTHYPTFPLGADDFIRYRHFIHIAHACKFFSEGKNGRFEMRVLISRHKHSEELDSYNLAFGVWDEECQDLDDMIEIKNGDSDVILATVGTQALKFLQENPNAGLYAQGSTTSRTRLYQREISKVIDYLPPDLKILGAIEGGEPDVIEFCKGTNFSGFLLTKK